MKHSPDTADIFRKEVREWRSMPLQGHVVLSQPVSYQLFAFVLVIIIVLSFAWLMLGTYARTEIIHGVIVTSEPPSKVYPTMPGTVESVLVKDGDYVKRGAILAAINTEKILASGVSGPLEELKTLSDRENMAEEQLELAKSKGRVAREGLRLQIRRAAAEAESLRSQIRLQDEIVKSNQDTFDRILTVAARGFISKIEVERRHQTLLISQQSLASLNQQLIAKEAEITEGSVNFLALEVEAGQVEKGLLVAKSTLSQQKTEIEGAKGYSVLAPVSGTVTSLQTAPGRRAVTSLPLLAIVPPQSELVADAYAPSRAIGFMRVGQEARILLDAFPYQQFGTVKAKISSISSILSDPDEIDSSVKAVEPVYKLRLTLDRQIGSSSGRQMVLQSGMAFQANIVLERKTFADWLIGPLRGVLTRWH